MVMLIVGDDLVLQTIDGQEVRRVDTADVIAATSDPAHGFLWIHSTAGLAVVDLLAPELSPHLIVGGLTVDSVAIEYGEAPFGPAPEVFIGLDSSDEPGTDYALLRFSKQQKTLSLVHVDDDGDATMEPLDAVVDAGWLARGRDRIDWHGAAERSVPQGCPVAQGELYCRPFGRSGLWLVGIHEELGDVLHVEVLFYDSQHKRWSVPREGVPIHELEWTSEPAKRGAEVDVWFAADGTAWADLEFVCSLGRDCRRLPGALVGVLPPGPRVAPSTP